MNSHGGSTRRRSRSPGTHAEPPGRVGPGRARVRGPSRRRHVEPDEHRTRSPVRRRRRDRRRRAAARVRRRTRSRARRHRRRGIRRRDRIRDRQTAGTGVHRRVDGSLSRTRARRRNLGDSGTTRRAGAPQAVHQCRAARRRGSWSRPAARSTSPSIRPASPEPPTPADPPPAATVARFGHLRSGSTCRRRCGDRGGGMPMYTTIVVGAHKSEAAQRSVTEAIAARAGAGRPRAPRLRLPERHAARSTARTRPAASMPSGRWTPARPVDRRAEFHDARPTRRPGQGDPPGRGGRRGRPHRRRQQGDEAAKAGSSAASPTTSRTRQPARCSSSARPSLRQARTTAERCPLIGCRAVWASRARPVAHRSVWFPVTVSVPLPFESITKTRRPMFSRVNGPGGVSVGAFHPTDPPEITTVVVPSDAVVSRRWPPGSLNEYETSVSRFVIFHIDVQPRFPFGVRHRRSCRRT